MLLNLVALALLATTVAAGNPAASPLSTCADATSPSKCQWAAGPTPAAPLTRCRWEPASGCVEAGYLTNCADATEASKCTYALAPPAFATKTQCRWTSAGACVEATSGRPQPTGCAVYNGDVLGCWQFSSSPDNTACGCVWTYPDCNDVPCAGASASPSSSGSSGSGDGSNSDDSNSSSVVVGAAVAAVAAVAVLVVAVAMVVTRRLRRTNADRVRVEPALAVGGLEGGDGDGRAVENPVFEL